MARAVSYGGDDLNLEATELRLGLPGSDGHEKQSSSATVRSNKRASPDVAEDQSARTKSNNSIVSDAGNGDGDSAPPAK
jgi:auxin-responsive protein IAA